MGIAGAGVGAARSGAAQGLDHAVREEVGLSYLEWVNVIYLKNLMNLMSVNMYDVASRRIRCCAN